MIHEPGFALGSPFFQENGFLLPRDTGDGEGLSPKLAWSNPPPGTRSFVLVMEDDDVRRGPNTHWLLYDLPATISSIAEGQPWPGVCGRNDFGRIDYESPLPPLEHGAHHYRFTLYALDVESLHLPEGANRIEVMQAMRPHLLGEVRLTARYHRQHAPA